MPAIQARRRYRQRTHIRHWTTAEIKDIRKYAGRKPADTIARKLKRTETAVRQKAHALGVSLACY